MTAEWCKLVAEVPEPSVGHVEPIIEAIEALPGHERRFVRPILHLATRCRAGLEASLRLVTHESPAIRRAVARLLPFVRPFPSDLATELCRFTVHDAHPGVRMATAEAIGLLGLDLVSELREQIDRETSRIIRESMLGSLELAIVGYRVDFVPEGEGILVEARTCVGWTEFRMTPEEMAAGLLHERIDEARERHERWSR